MNGKSRYWSCILYEDSMPKDWKVYLSELAIPCVLSPLHDKDKYEKDIYEGEELKHKQGEIKKAHYHLLLCWGSPTTYNNVLDYMKPLGVKVIKRMASSRGAYEYLTHKNNPEKAQYDEEKIQTFNGFSKEESIGYSEQEIERMKRDIIDLINMLKFTEYKEIYDYCNQNKMWDYTNIISHNTIFYNSYLKSKKNMLDNFREQAVKLRQGNI